MPETYEIDAAYPSHEVLPNGTLKDVMEVSFHTLPELATGAVRVPLAPGWETAAAAAILQRVAELRALYGA